MKRLIAIVFAISVFNVAPVAAHHTYGQPPAWITQRVEQGQRCKKWEPWFRKYGLPVEWFTYICWRESRAAQTATNWNDSPPSYGLLQINGSHTTLTAKLCKGEWGDLKVLYRPGCNLKVAKYLYDRYGLAPWGF